MHMRKVRTSASPAAQSRELEGADLGRGVSEVREGVESLTARIDTLARACAAHARDDHLVVTEGPFVGDAPAALETTRLWLERSRHQLTSSAQSLVQAHIAAGGLASGD